MPPIANDAPDLSREILNIASEAKTESHRAVQLATKAVNELDKHEEICSLRYAGILDKLIAQKVSIDKLIDKAWIVAGTIIVLLLGAIGTLIALIMTIKTNI